MNDTITATVVLVIAVGVLVGAAFLLQKRANASKDASKARVEMSLKRRICLWIIRVDVLLLVVFAVYALIFQNLTYAWIALPLLGVYIITSMVSRAFWLTERLKKESSEQDADTSFQVTKNL